MPTKLFHSTQCPLCGSTSQKEYDVIYPANYQASDITTLFSARRLPDGIHSQIVRCKRDGQVRSNPVLNDSTLNHLYKESEFNYQHEVKNLVDTYLRALAHILPNIKKTDKILEIGCGSGFVLSALKKTGYQNVFGVEPSQQAVEIADRSIKSKIVVKPFSATLFPKHTFKCIFFLQTLDHIPDPKFFLKGCFSQLTPGGFILSFHHNVDSSSAKLMGEKSPIFDIEHTYLYSHRTSRLLFEKAGFTVTEVFSPANTVSAFHLFWLIPFPTSIKKKLVNNSWLKNSLQKIQLQIPLGNTCLIAYKPL